MKKLIKVGLLFGLMFLLAGSAWALPIKGDEVTMSIASAPWPYVPYVMTNKDTSDEAKWDKYFSFCIERTVLFTPDVVTYEVASVEDTVNDETKWLYASFVESTYTNDSMNAKNIQLAIWWFEDRENLTNDEQYLAQNTWNNNFSTSYNALNNTELTTFLADWDIQAVSFSNGQNQVVGSNNNNPVPEPATMILFGIGLLSMAGVGRKK